MIITIEGADNTGKTTLAVRLARDLRCLYLKTEIRPPTQANLDGMAYLLREAQRYSPTVITDRHHVISEPVYGPIIRGHNPFDEVEIRQTLKSMAVIWCDPGRETSLDFSRNMEEQMQGVRENAETLYDAYTNFFDRYGSSCYRLIKYNRQIHGYEDLRNQILSWPF